MDIQQLLYLVKSIDNGNISQTAQELNISQPAVTKGIKKLETELQARLIVRHGKGIKATSTGETLYRHAKAILNQVKRATDDIEFTKGNRPESLSIGCSPSFIDGTLPAIMSAFLKLWPTCTLNLTTTLYTELITALKNGELDAVLALDFHSHSVSDIHVEVLGQSEIAFIVNPNHPLATVDTLSVEQMNTARWIILDATDTVAYFQSLFQSSGLTPINPVVYSQSMSIIKSSLLSNELIGFLPKHMVENELKNASLVRVNVDVPVRKMDLILAHNDSLFPSAMLKGFLDIAANVVADSAQRA